MENYIFSANRQLMFYVGIGGQSRLVQFGSRNVNGTSLFQTSDDNVAEAIRKHSLFKRGAITEFEREKTVKKPAKPVLRYNPIVQEPVNTVKKPEVTVIDDNEEYGQPVGTEVIEAKNFTQAKSMLAKRLNIKYNDIKNPGMLVQLAKDAGITIKY